MGIRLDGLPEALDLFDRVDAALQATTLQPELGSLAERGRDIARSLAPVYAGPPEKGVVPGELKEKIFSHSYEKNGEPAALFGTRDEEVPYAPDVEFGNHNDAAQPFLRPAFDQVARDADQVLADALGKLLD